MILNPALPATIPNQSDPFANEEEFIDPSVQQPAKTTVAEM